MASLMAIRNELREVDPSVEWIAFGFGGGGDSFQGFESFEIFTKGKRKRNASSRDLDFITYGYLDDPPLRGLPRPANQISEHFGISISDAQELIQLKTKLKGDESFEAEALKLLSKALGFDLTNFSKWNSVLNEDSNSSTILEAIVPEGVSLKCTDSGSCSGILFFALEPLKAPLAIDLKEFSESDCYHFDIKTGFMGIATGFHNSDSFSGGVEAQ